MGFNLVFKGLIKKSKPKKVKRGHWSPRHRWQNVTKLDLEEKRQN